MKKKLKLFLVVITALGCLSGCGQKTEGPTVQDDTSSSEAVFAEDENQIDFFESFYSIGVAGFNGKGRIWDLGYELKYITYDRENLDITEFLKDVKLNLQQNGAEVGRYDECWSNGDILTITLSYSKSTADELGISFKETSKDFMIWGFLEENNPPETEEKIDVTAIAGKLADELSKEDKIVSAYSYYLSDNAITRKLGERGDGTFNFPSGYEYCNELLDEDGGVRFINTVTFIVSGENGYYFCEVGISPDGTQCGDFIIAHRYYKTEDEVVEYYIDSYGKNNVIRVGEF